MNLRPAISLLRPKHWAKNVFVLAPLMFAGKFTDIVSVADAIVAFLTFSAAASAVYIFNDLQDMEADRLHAIKSLRPLASGAIRRQAAWQILAVLLVLAAVGTLYISEQGRAGFAACLVAYLLINVYYTLVGKHQVIVDAFCIAIGFVLRVVAGALAIGVETTGWIVVTTFFLSLFLGFGKRRGEIVSMDQPAMHRGVLASYPVNLLDQIIVSTGTIAIISYALYTLDAGVTAKFGSTRLYYTVIPVAYGVFRYMYLLLRGEESNPTEVLMQDRGLLLTVVVWLVAAAGIVYIDGGQFR